MLYIYLLVLKWVFFLELMLFGFIFFFFIVIFSIIVNICVFLSFYDNRFVLCFWFEIIEEYDSILFVKWIWLMRFIFFYILRRRLVGIGEIICSEVFY